MYQSGTTRHALQDRPLLSISLTSSEGIVWVGRSRARFPINDTECCNQTEHIKIIYHMLLDQHKFQLEPTTLKKYICEFSELYSNLWRYCGTP